MKMLLDLLDFEEVSAGKKELEVETVDTAGFVAEMIEHWQKIAATKDVGFECRMPDTLPENMNFNRQQIRRILDELLDNAFKFTKTGKVTLSADFVGDDKVLIKVKDTGAGIPAEAIDHVLEPFGQLDSSHARDNDGTGIGLALCNEMVKRMGGNMSVTSALGRGTTIGLLLPVLVERETPLVA